MMKNKITLAICIYNAEKYIVETLQCILGQTLRDFNLLLINDCSTDGGIALAEAYLCEHQREYRLVNFEMNQGIAFARQKALELATTQYLIFVDSDDLPHPTLLEGQYSLMMTDSSIMGVDCWSQFIDENSKKMKGGLFIGAETKEEYYKKAQKGKLFFMPIQCLFDRELALRVGGFRLDGFSTDKPRYQDFCEDLDLWTRMSDLYSEGKYMITIPEVLYSYRKSGQGLSSNRLYMGLKMRFVKMNLKRRRREQEEIAFTEFLESLGQDEMHKLEREAEVATLFSNSASLILRGCLCKGGYLLLKSFIMSPRYFFQKLNANVNIFK